MIYVCNIAVRLILGVKFFRQGEIFSSWGEILSLWCVIRVPHRWGLDFGVVEFFRREISFCV